MNNTIKFSVDLKNSGKRLDIFLRENIKSLTRSFLKKLIESENVTVVVQVNGKKRGLFNLKKNTEEKELLSLIQKDEKLNKYLENKKIKKQIFVKNKILNLII